MGAKVLVADDSGVMRKLISRMLNAVGVADVTETQDGAEALEQFGQQDFDVVLADWDMPNMSGIELLQGIRSGGSKKPVILMLTIEEKDRVDAGSAAGARDHLVKPIEIRALKEMLSKFAVVTS